MAKKSRGESLVKVSLEEDFSDLPKASVVINILQPETMITAAERPSELQFLLSSPDIAITQDYDKPLKVGLGVVKTWAQYPDVETRPLLTEHNSNLELPGDLIA
ncbi:hypothetical protein AJ80_01236 [Polytolypa hystricis UAMH7299]|uniref:Uncharacterized protein n=1 Tax=Polytolypa hystricis (strain UAMH7299) TaxID=1447883 RepID=A0A2B7Z0V0_POLH7|nr:hypothetical protein AJ80_01236 [Polytolypa hystricis UAMH7299]